MGSFTSTTPDTAGAKAAASSHADQIQGAAPAAPVSAPAAYPAPSPTPGISGYSHADQIMGANIMPGDQPDFRIEPLDFPDPSNSPWLNPPRTGANVLDPFGGTGGPAVSPASGARDLPAPPALPPKPAPAPTLAPGLAGRAPGNHGQTPIYRPNEVEGGGNTAESAAYVQKKNADARKIAKTEARVEARHAEERAKVARERQKTAEKVQRWHAEEIADAQKAQVAQRRQIAQTLTKTVATKVKQLMEPAGHPGLSDDAKSVQKARRAALSAEAAASNDRQVKALGRIGGVGGLPLYTSDAAENYGDKGIDEVADPESSSGQASSTAPPPPTRPRASNCSTGPRPACRTPRQHGSNKPSRAISSTMSRDLRSNMKPALNSPLAQTTAEIGMKDYHRTRGTSACSPAQMTRTSRVPLNTSDAIGPTTTRR